MKSDVQVTGKHFRITRVFDAPRAMVFDWWRDAGKLQQWSGCKEATKCEVEMDFRVGGSFTQKMQIANRCEFVISGRYEEIRVPEKIGYRLDLGHAITQVTIEFFEEGDQTRVVLTQHGFPDENSCSIVSHGSEESLEKLGTILAGQIPAARH